MEIRVLRKVVNGRTLQRGSEWSCVGTMGCPVLARESRDDFGEIVSLVSHLNSCFPFSYHYLMREPARVSDTVQNQSVHQPVDSESYAALNLMLLSIRVLM